MPQLGRIDNIVRNLMLDLALVLVFLILSTVAFFTPYGTDKNFNEYDYASLTLSFLFIAHLLLYFGNAIYRFFNRQYATGFVLLAVSMTGIFVFWILFALYLLVRGAPPATLTIT